MPHGRRTMTVPDGHRHDTVFPATPGDLALLTIQEFTFRIYDVQSRQGPPVEQVRRIFMEDANRVLVWSIRFGALKNWCATNVDRIEGVNGDSEFLRDAYELAASFPVNAFWEFDPSAFECAVQAMADTRMRAASRSATRRT